MAIESSVQKMENSSASNYSTITFSRFFNDKRVPGEKDNPTFARVERTSWRTPAKLPGVLKWSSATEERKTIIGCLDVAIQDVAKMIDQLKEATEKNQPLTVMRIKKQFKRDIMVDLISPYLAEEGT